MLSNKECAEFIKGILTSLGLKPDLDQFLKAFDQLTIIPTPPYDSKTDPGYVGGVTAHIAKRDSDTVHVDAPFASDLVPTLLHETFHSNSYGVSDRVLAAIAGKPVPPNAKEPSFTGSRNASMQFDKYCTPQSPRTP